MNSQVSSDMGERTEELISSNSGRDPKGKDAFDLLKALCHRSTDILMCYFLYFETFIFNNLHF